MSSQPGGPNRQPLQTYLGSAVRPTAAAPPAAAAQPAPIPVAAPVGRHYTPPQPQLFATSPTTSVQSGVFATPPLFGAPSSAAAPPASAGSADLLSSLLDPSPSQTPRQSVSSVFAENAAGSPAAAAQPQQQFNYSAANASSSAPSSAPSSAGPGSLSVSTLTPSSSFSQPQPVASQISVSSSPLGGPSATPAARLEPAFDHPLGGPAAPVGPSPSPSPGVQGLLGSAPAPSGGHSTVLAGPLGPLGPARTAGPALPPRILQRGTSQTDPLNNTGPSPTAKSPLMSTAAAQAYAATQLQQQQLAQLQQAPQASPDEKLSSLLAALFQGTPPPAKLAAFDVSAVPRNEEGLVALAEKGCWREVVKLAEALLDFNPKATDINAAAGKEAGAAATTTLAPHTFYRLLHYYLAALVKLRKYDAAFSTAQSRLGSCWGADKLYASHPAHYPASEASAERVGNMLPFELHLLSCQLVSYLPPAAGSSQLRTRQALDQCMKLLQWLRAMITRKKAEENGAALPPAPGGVGDASSPHALDKRGSVGLPEGSAAGAGSGGPTTLSSSNPFSLTSPHTLSPLSSAQLTTQLCVARLHVANLCLSWSSSLDVDFEQSLAWLEDLRAEDAASNGGQADPAIHECLARVHLQVGDLASATDALHEARKGYEARGEKEHVNIGLHQ